MVVDDDAVVGQQLGRHRAHARRRRDGQRDVHVLDDGGGGAAQRALLAGGDRGGRPSARARASPRRPCLGACALGRLLRPERARPGRVRREPAGPADAAGFGWRGLRAVGLAGRRRWPRRRACRGRRRRPGCPAGSRRRTRARPGPRWTGRRGTAGTSPRPATRWCRIPPRRTRTRRRAGMSSRLTRGGVPSSSVGCVRWLGRDGTARPGVESTPVRCPDRVRRACAGGIEHAAGAGYSVAPWATSSSARASCPSPGPRRCAGGGPLPRGSCRGRWRRRGWSRSRRRRRRAAPGRSRARRRPARRRPRRAAGCGRWPDRAGSRRRPPPAGGAPVRSRAPPAAKCSAPVSASAPRSQEQLRRGRGASEGGPRQQVDAAGPVAGSAPSSRWRVSCVDVPQVGRARRVDLAPSSRRSGTSSGRSCSATCSGVRLKSVRAVRSAPAFTSTRTTSACPSATARCSGVQPPCPSRSTVRVSRLGEVSHGGPDGVDVARGDQPGQALDGHASGQWLRPGMRSGPVPGTAACQRGAGRTWSVSDDVAPDGEQGAEHGGDQTVTEQQQRRPATARAGPAPGSPT